MHALTKHGDAETVENIVTLLSAHAALESLQVKDGDSATLEKIGKPEEGTSSSLHLTKQMGLIWRELSKDVQEVRLSRCCVGTNFR